MKRSDVNHLRRLVAWVRCEAGQDPDELVKTMEQIADKLGHPDIDDSAKARLVTSYDRARSIPKYVRNAIKAMEKYLQTPGETVEEPQDVLTSTQQHIPYGPNTRTSMSDAERAAFFGGMCVALTAAFRLDEPIVWAEIARMGGDELLHYATYVKPDEWEVAGFSKLAKSVN